ncbi:DUF4337 domain-containing protein [Maribacter cobaltidurans]|uniref:Uncharacterized protein n=1 Tax=Maribacter cobaltidurans TaxID=1178778 RepID=A0A223V962_9FLAO|nr:DUF4337 domain-containing protein [Maribacter cobaltidurans]ASV31921.1 hypothetical protein CJ263_17810 [Maribacter cobaltidurans]GGD85700.1 hypothetical protein GCM10011412_24380 [Maribacter cobaltidurans]
MLQSKKSQEMVEVSVASERAEAVGGVLIAFFAAFMAISQMINGELEEEMMIAHNKVVNYSSWYQSKSIKESLKESELDYLQALLESGVVVEDKVKGIQEKVDNVKLQIEKYASEKNEILIGSANIPQESWAQDLDGEMGKIVGINEWEALADEYDFATKKFDLGMLFFQISIVLGAVCIIIYDNPLLQKTFIVCMIISGIIGTLLSIYGYTLAP